MIAIKPAQERRKDPRLENNIPIKICQDDGDLVAEIQNISRSGVYCRVDKPIDMMTRLKVHILLPSVENGKKSAKKISCEGVVVRSQPAADDEGYYIAIFFSVIGKRDAEFIMDYVGSSLKKDSAVS